MSSWTYGTMELNKIAGSGDNAMLNLSGLAEGMGLTSSSTYITMPRADDDNQFRPALYFKGKDNNLHNFYNQNMGNRSLMRTSNHSAGIFFGLLFNSQGFTEANAPQTQFVIGTEKSISYSHDALYLDSICFPDFDYQNDSINFVCQYGYLGQRFGIHKSVISITHKDNILNDNLEKPWIVMINSYENSNKFFNDLDSLREIVILSNNKMYEENSQNPLKYQPMNDITGLSDYAYSRQMIFSDYLGFNTEDHKLYASPVLKNAVLYDKRVKDGAMVYNNPHDGKEYLVVMRGCPSMAPLVVQGY